MHPQAGCRIHFHNTTALFLQRFVDAVADHINAADVQTNHVRGRNGAGGEIRVNVVGDIGGGATGAQVGVFAQIDAGAA